MGGWFPPGIGRGPFGPANRDGRVDFDIPMFESDEFGRNAPGAADAPEAAFRADLSGFDGPLDLLLDLAKKHRIDLRALSMNDLADQYLLFVQDALHQRLELAADYLVMAAWLVYLKSRLLLPEPVKPDEPATADLVGDLTARLRRLEAVRRAREWLSRKADLVAETFPRGTPERPETRAGAWAHTLDELAAAYARQRQDKANRQVTIAPRLVWTLQQGRETLAGALAPEIGRAHV